MNPAGSDEARATWASRFKTRQISLPRGTPEPFSIGRRLGGGGLGIVHETRLGGIPLALKRTYARSLTEEQLNEIKILSRISEQRHHHVVELIGSYILRQRSVYELGLLIWPVAHCDLAALLHDIHCIDEYLYTSIRPRNADDEDTSITDDLKSTLESLSSLLDLNPTQATIYDIRYRARSRLKESIGCITSAVAYIHDHGIRHKDLKPSQILLSPHGLWLADFGWSRDRSGFSDSVTSGGDRITAKYQAPERANGQPCGRSEDVFSLGCIFLEIDAAVHSKSLSWSQSRPWAQRGWSFQANLDEVLQHLNYNSQALPDIWSRSYNRLMAEMLRFEPAYRPTIDGILHRLHGGLAKVNTDIAMDSSHFGRCCLEFAVNQGSSQISLESFASKTSYWRTDIHLVKQRRLTDSIGSRQSSSSILDHRGPSISATYVRTGWGCGFCLHFSNTRQDHFYHISLHLKMGETLIKNWTICTVIASLLQRPVIWREWERLWKEKQNGNIVNVTWNTNQYYREFEDLLYEEEAENIDFSFGRPLPLKAALECFTSNEDAAAIAQQAFDLAVKHARPRELSRQPNMPEGTKLRDVGIERILYEGSTRGNIDDEENDWPDYYRSPNCGTDGLKSYHILFLLETLGLR